MSQLKTVFKTKRKPIIGMIHLPPLPGYSNHPGMSQVIKKALKDLKTLEKAGFDAALAENDNDQPHHIGVDQKTKEAFVKVMLALKKQAKIPIGMEIIYDMLGTVEVANKTKADFIRLDVFVDDVRTKWGDIYGQAQEINQLKNKLKSDNLITLTDIQVKHAEMLSNKTLETSAREAFNQGSDGLIITGAWTGKEPSVNDLKRVITVAKGKIPILIGSGFSAENAPSLYPLVDAVIVGTSIKTGEYVDLKKAKNLITVVTSLDS